MLDLKLSEEPISFCIFFQKQSSIYIYRKVTSRNKCYYSENQVFGGATKYKPRHVTKRDVFVFMKLQILNYKVLVTSMPHSILWYDFLF